MAPASLSIQCASPHRKLVSHEMSGKVGFVEGEHRPAIIEGPLTALSWLTILPVQGATAFDRVTGGRVLASVPLIGILLGALGTMLAGLGVHFHITPFLIAVAIVCFWELFTRFMHLDGLADVADALGSYAPPERAREIIADPTTGLIGMGAAFISLTLQIASFDALIGRGYWWMILFAPMIGRLCAIFGAHSSLKPMQPTGFGAMMIGTVPTATIAIWFSIIVAASVSIPLFVGSPVIAVIVLIALLFSIGIAVLEIRHCSRRFEGMNGDTTGFIMHSCTAASAVFLAIGACAV